MPLCQRGISAAQYLKKVIEIGSEEVNVDKKNVRVKAISWFRSHIKEFDFKMNDVYETSGLSRQAYHQQLRRDCSRRDRHNHILRLAEEKRKSHPRAGARKLFKLTREANIVQRLISSCWKNITSKYQ